MLIFNHLGKHVYRYILAFSLIGVFCSCEELMLEQNASDVYVKYTIPQGEHYANNRSFKTFQEDGIRFNVKFDSTGIYETQKPTNQIDINKLYGFSDCDSTIHDHHVNSARFGWRWYNDEMQLFAYTYKNKQNSQAYVTSIELNKEHTLNIGIQDDQYVFTVDGKEAYVTMERGCTDESSTKSKIYPYFGGDEPAPHDISIEIQDIIVTEKK